MQNLKKYVTVSLIKIVDFFKNNDKKEIIRKIIFGVSILVFLFSVYKIVSVQLDYYYGNREYTALQKMLEDTSTLSTQSTTGAGLVVSPTPSLDTNLGGNAASGQTLQPTPSPTPKPTLPPYTDKTKSDFKILSKMNKDITGWIYINGTKVNYPVVQAKDNEIYLTRTFEGSTRKCGSLFIDYRNNKEFKSRNTIIYGHNMKNGTMFHNLRYYRDGNKDIPSRFIRVNSPKGNLTYEVFSVYITDTVFDYLKVDFENDKTYMTYLNQITKKSVIRTKITPTKTDKILTLSTCSYDFENARLVVHARLIKTE